MKERIVKYCFVLFFSILFIFPFSTKVKASPSRRVLVELSQPTGQKFKAVVYGDEWLNWAEDNEGCILLKTSEGFWKYAEIVNDKLTAGDSKYMIDTKPKNTIINEDIYKIKTDHNLKTSGKSGSDRLLGHSNNLNQVEPVNENHSLLVLLVEFDDIKMKYSQDEWHNRFFGEHTSSVNDYYLEVSNGRFKFDCIKETSDMVNDGIVKIKLDYNHPNPGGYTGLMNQLIVRDAINYADRYVDFSAYDKDNNGQISMNELHIVTVIAGYEESYGEGQSPSIWGHRWSLYGDNRIKVDGVGVAQYPYGGYTQQGEIHGNHMATIGVLCHELGHDLGLPDLYDSDYSSLGVGVHSLMASGSWTYTEGNYDGSSPTHLDPWSKMTLGFTATKIVDANGVYKLNSNSTGNYEILKIVTKIPNEYFLIENRQMEGFDRGLYFSNVDGGIAIWHVDDKVIADNDFNYVNDDESHKGVDLEEANVSSLGFSQLDKKQYGYKLYHHYYSLDSYSRFGIITIPDSNLYNGEKTNITLNIKDSSSDSMGLEIYFNENPETPVNIKDKNLERAIRDTTKIYDRELTVGDMGLLMELNGDGYGITELTGLEKAVNLSKLSLRYNSIEDISTLQELNNLKFLFLDGNRISDISRLSELTALEELSLSNYKSWDFREELNDDSFEILLCENKNTIKDFMPLKKLISLKKLNINGTNCKNISFLGELINLQEIYADGNNIDNISYLYLLKNLNIVCLGNNQISNIETLAHLKQIKALLINNNKISTINHLIGLSNIEHLCIEKNNLSDISQLSKLQNLKLLCLASNKITSIAAMKFMKNLEIVDLSSNAIFDVSSISQLSKLVWLNLSNNRIVDIKPLVQIYKSGGLLKGSFVNLSNNNLDINEHSQTFQDINYLITNGVSILFDPQKPMLEVLDINPANNEPGIDVKCPIVITFNHPIYKGDYFSKITIKDSRGKSVSADKMIKDTMLIIKPKEMLKESTTYTISISSNALKNSDGIGMASDFSSIFMTFDNIAPIITKTLPSNNYKNLAVNTSISIYFTEEIKESTNFHNITLYDNSGKTTAINCLIEDNQLIITPAQNLKHETKYYLQLPMEAVEDNNENILKNEYKLTFTTEASLKVVTASPRNNSKMVSLKKEINIKFNKKIQAGVSFSQITLRSGDIDFKVDLKISGYNLIIKPYIGLKPYSQFSLSIPYNAISDYNSDTLFHDYILNFSSGKDSYAPMLVLNNPVKSQTVLDADSTNFILDFIAMDEGGIKEIKITGMDFAETISQGNNEYIPEIAVKKVIPITISGYNKFYIEVTDTGGKKYNKTISLYKNA